MDCFAWGEREMVQVSVTQESGRLSVVARDVADRWWWWWW